MFRRRHAVAGSNRKQSLLYASRPRPSGALEEIDHASPSVNDERAVYRFSSTCPRNGSCSENCSSKWARVMGVEPCSPAQPLKTRAPGNAAAT